eukprot:TRINITY_DN508_c0_g1_i2.p1 TRINITY_DN508_c0_g1~~TRINITY_DN508_c0_g1_i2.p1  ORF type:complete len:175 (-),score=41.32 TRINITY_DN508_c0_g1_i2:63-587(-)
MDNYVTIQNVQVLENPAKFDDVLKFEITLYCNTRIDDDIELNVVYVGSAIETDDDQVLESILLGPIEVGHSKFVMQVNPPDYKKIQPGNLLGATALLITCYYHKQEFVRVGYFVINEYENNEMNENPPPIPRVGSIVRKILSDEPRFTTFTIDWGDGNNMGMDMEPMLLDSDSE